MASIRSFLSIPASNRLRASAASVIENLQSVSSGVKWERPEKLHITVKFLGSVDTDLLRKIAETLKPRLEQMDQFNITYAGLGAFPTIHNPRILWIGADGGRNIVELFSAVEQVCSSFNIPSEDRTFHAHVTIGRVKNSRALNRLTAMVKSVTFEPIVARCSELCVMKSELHPSGSQYTVVQSIPLKS
jgi:RNA 2',3'-cyclic 3'-phosphodiesterase